MDCLDFGVSRDIPEQLVWLEILDTVVSLEMLVCRVTKEHRELLDLLEILELLEYRDLQVSLDSLVLWELKEPLVCLDLLVRLDQPARWDFRELRVTRDHRDQLEHLETREGPDRLDQQALREIVEPPVQQVPLVLPVFQDQLETKVSRVAWAPWVKQVQPDLLEAQVRSVSLEHLDT